MNKTQLIDAVAKNSTLKKREVEDVIEKFIDTIIAEVAAGEKVQITGFGAFERKTRGERNIKNPRTGEDMKVPPSKSPSFSAGSVFKDKVNK
ncbi:MAG: HU family DNA-binding protein [Oscillospiraceae bacterium]|nr:HU family DNA-binding protein [Oscillospiraceae bacterium]